MTPDAQLIGHSPAIANVRRAIAQVAETDATVLVLGETGTGKEVVARSIHARSRRAVGPFVAANCGGFVAGLAASELFGHEAGAFTSAIRRRIGKFESAQGGTLLLDEVGELPLELQPLLLRVLESQAVERIGGDVVPVSVRVVAATHRHLAADVGSLRFRADLYYRLNVFPIILQPLRERRADIPELADQFLRQFAAAHGRKVTSIPARGLRLLTRYDWPGNVRKLRNVIERGILTSIGSDLQIDPDWLSTDTSSVETARTWAVQEKARILEALQASEGRIYGPGGAAQRLGLRPTTLYGKMRKHGISKESASWQ